MPGCVPLSAVNAFVVVTCAAVGVITQAAPAGGHVGGVVPVSYATLPGCVPLSPVNAFVVATCAGVTTITPAGSLPVRGGPTAGVTVAVAVFTVVPTTAVVAQICVCAKPAPSVAIVTLQPGTRASTTS